MLYWLLVILSVLHPSCLYPKNFLLLQTRKTSHGVSFRGTENFQNCLRETLQEVMALLISQRITSSSSALVNMFFSELLVITYLVRLST